MVAVWPYVGVPAKLRNENPAMVNIESVKRTVSNL